MAAAVAEGERPRPGAEGETERGSGLWPGAEGETERGSGLWPGTETEAARGSGLWPGAEGETERGSGLWPGAEGEAARGSGLWPGAEGETETAAARGSGLWPGAEGETERGSGLRPGAETETETEAARGSGLWPGAEGETERGSGLRPGAEGEAARGSGLWPGAEGETERGSGLRPGAETETETARGSGLWPEAEGERPGAGGQAARPGAEEEEEEEGERPGPGGEAAGGPGPEDSGDLQRAEERLGRLLAQCEPGLLLLQRLLVWERPAHSGLMLLGLSGVFWLFSSTSLRPIFLISSSLLGILLLDRWKSGVLARVMVQHPVDEDVSDGSSTRPRLLRLPDLCHCLAESWVAFHLYLKEVLEYKRQNPGKFCLKMCIGCSATAAIGHYIPGIMISYIFILSLLLWPLVVYHELIQKMYTGLEPVLMKLDYSMKGSTQHRQRDRKKKLLVKAESCDEPTAETESESEAELSCFNPKMDVRTTALAFAITDSELSDEEASILESGGFTVSRGTTPQLSDVSEDLERQSVHSEPEEAFARDLAEFPSVEELSGDGSPSHGVARLAARDSPFFTDALTSPLHFVNSHFNGSQARRSQPSALGSALHGFSEEMVASALSTVVRNTLTSLLSGHLTDGHTPSSELLPTQPDQSLHLQTAAAGLGLSSEPPPHEELDDFELLDQGELEQMDTELGLEEGGRLGSEQAGSSQPTPTGPQDDS